MTAMRDPDRLIHAFLDEGWDDLPDRAYDEVRAEIEHTRQRFVFGPWRYLNLSKFATIGIAAAVIVLAVVVGVRLLPNNSGVGVGPQPTEPPTQTPTLEPTPSPTLTSTPAPTPVDTPSATEAATPSSSPDANPEIEDPEGQLQPGITYVAHPFDDLFGMDARPFTFTVPSDKWQAQAEPGRMFGISYEGSEKVGEVGIGFLKVHSLNTDICHWTTDEVIEIGPTANDLLEALDGSDNVELTTNGTDVVTMTMPTTLPDPTDAGCDQGEYAIWNSEGFDIYPQGPSNTWLLHIDDFGGRYVILRSYLPDTPDEVIEELESIYNSITVSDDHGCPQYDHTCN